MISGLAHSREFIKGPGVRLPIFRRIDDVWYAALLEQLHECDACEAEFVGCLARRDPAIPKKGKNSLFAQEFLESGLVGGIIINVDLNLQLHGTFIVPL